MKKKIIGVFLIVMLTSLTVKLNVKAVEVEETKMEEAEMKNTESEIQADTEIVFDPDAVINKTAAKSALADMHGVFVFRNAFIAQEAIVKQREKEERDAIEKTVLTSVQPDLGYKEWAEVVLAANTEKYIKDVYIEEKENTVFIWIYCIILSVCILCIAIRTDLYLKEKKRKEEKTLNYEIKGMLLLFLVTALSVHTACNEKKQKDEEYILELDENIRLVCDEETRPEPDEILTWDYEDANEDDRDDIVLMTQDAVWIFVQAEDGEYVFYEKEALTPMKKRAY